MTMLRYVISIAKEKITAILIVCLLSIIYGVVATIFLIDSSHSYNSLNSEMTDKITLLNNKIAMCYKDRYNSLFLKQNN